MTQQRFTGGNNLTPIVKNLLIINVLMFVGKIVLQSRGIDLDNYLGLYHPYSAHFRPWQLLTHMFMHSFQNESVMHLLGNMLGLFFFGPMLEVRWGDKRFLSFYLLTGFAAALLHFGIIHYQVTELMAMLSPENIELAKQADFISNAKQGLYNSKPTLLQLGIYLGVPTIGASGAIFGILGACLILVPNTTIHLIFPPIPLKLKYAITFYGLYELFSGVANIPGDNVAHFAHLGGLIAGIIIVKYWNKTKRDSFF